MPLNMKLFNALSPKNRVKYVQRVTKLLQKEQQAQAA